MLTIKYKAVTPDERALGMRGKPALRQGEAMLFTYDNPQMVSFWNRGVPFPLDVGYINEKGTLFQKGSLDAGIDGKKVTYSLYSNGPVTEVIETAKGELDKYPLGTHKSNMYLS